MNLEIRTITESQFGPFIIGATYNGIIEDLIASRTSFSFRVKGEKEYITIAKPVINGIKFKEMGTYSEVHTKLIRLDSLEHRTLDELSSLTDFFQSIFGKPDEMKQFGATKDFVHELFTNSEHQVVRDAYQQITGTPSMMRWNMKDTKCILLFSILEHEEEPLVRYTCTIRLSLL